MNLYKWISSSNYKLYSRYTNKYGNTILTRNKEKFLTKDCESFRKLESEALRNKRRFGDKEPRRKRGDFFSPHSKGDVDPRRDNLRFGDSENFTFADMETQEILGSLEPLKPKLRDTKDLWLSRKGINRGSE